LKREFLSIDLGEVSKNISMKTLPRR